MLKNTATVSPELTRFVEALHIFIVSSQDDLAIFMCRLFDHTHQRYFSSEWIGDLA